MPSVPIRRNFGYLERSREPPEYLGGSLLLIAQLNNRRLLSVTYRDVKGKGWTKFAVVIKERELSEKKQNSKAEARIL
jgi:hypothetical protein